MKARIIGRVFGFTFLAVALFGFGYLATVVFIAPTHEAKIELAEKANEVIPDTVSLMKVPVPADSDCTACHPTGVIQPTVPRMAHQVEGWENCTACHADGKLVQTAPGHAGIHKESCLLCHQPPAAGSAQALPRPHHLVTGKNCTSCHGAGAAPLPTTMEGRKNCWVCHPAADSEKLFENS